jgi:hypothetical protein
MVLAAPIFLVTQTKALSVFYAANREPLLRLGLGATIAWLSLRLLARTYECAALAEDLALSSRTHAQLVARFSSAPWLSATAGAVAAAPPGAREAALGAALGAAAREAAAAAAAEGAVRAREASWLPKNGALERAHAATTATAGGGKASGGGSFSVAPPPHTTAATTPQGPTADAPPRGLL